jgi:predicted DNA-binding transcriptional regulator YafY
VPESGFNTAGENHGPGGPARQAVEDQVAGIDEIKFWILTWGSNTEVLEPPALREEIRTEAAGTLERYNKKPRQKDKSGAG